MHHWNDDWFNQHGDKLYAAINYFEITVNRYARIGAYGKEKYGTYRESTTFWGGGIHGLFYPGHVWVKYPFLYFTIDRNVIKPLTRFSGLHKLGVWWQRLVYNYAIQTACKKYPETIVELVSGLDYAELVKPGIFGNVCGKTLYEKRWKKYESK